MTSTVGSSLSRSHSVTRLALFFGAWLFSAVRFVQALLNRRDVRVLLEMNERELKDIGLVRNDVLGALSVPLYRDPSSILMVRSVERRARSRALALIAARSAAAGKPAWPATSAIAETGWR